MSRLLSRNGTTGRLYLVMDVGLPREDGFPPLFELAEPRLRRALVAGFGPTVGREAAVEALGWAWQHWDRMAAIDNPVGYLYRVGETAARRTLAREARQRTLADALADQPRRDGDVGDAHLAAADLAPALQALSIHQRTAVVLVHGYGMPLREVADMMQISVASVREHTTRAISRLRTVLEVPDADRC